jgi:hypothetical protein
MLLKAQDNVVRAQPFCVTFISPDLLGRTAMKAFLLACVAALVVAALGFGVLSRVQEPVEQAFATTAVRL